MKKTIDESFSGKVVLLKSGGPLMTAERYDAKGRVLCVSSNGTKYYAENVLGLATEDEINKG